MDHRLAVIFVSTLWLGSVQPAIASTFHCGSLSADLDVLESRRQSEGTSHPFYKTTYRIRYSLEKGIDVPIGVDTHLVLLSYEAVNTDGQRRRGELQFDANWGTYTTEVDSSDETGEVIRANLIRITCAPNGE